MKHIERWAKQIDSVHRASPGTSINTQQQLISEHGNGAYKMLIVWLLGITPWTNALYYFANQ